MEVCFCFAWAAKGSRFPMHSKELWVGAFYFRHHVSPLWGETPFGCDCDYISRKTGGRLSSFFKKLLKTQTRRFILGGRFFAFFFSLFARHFFSTAFSILSFLFPALLHMLLLDRRLFQTLCFAEIYDTLRFDDWLFDDFPISGDNSRNER